MRNLFRTIAATSLAILVSQGAMAVPQAWTIIPKESSLTFTAVQNNAPVTGEFKTFTGEILFDPDHLSEAKVNIVVDLNSVSASYSDIVATLKSPEWFNVKMFPQAKFSAASFTKTGKDTYEAKGNLTIRDKTVPVVLSFVFSEYTSKRAKAKGSTTIQRNAFGVGQGEWASTDTVKDGVKVEFVVVAGK